MCGYLCDDCHEHIFPAVVYLYLPWQQERLLETTVASTKDTFRLVTEDEKKQRSKLLIAKTETDEKGNFEFEIDEKYKATAFDIDFECGTVPRTPIREPRKKPLQFHLTTFYPQWIIEKIPGVEFSEIYYFHWHYCISAKWWCYIRGYYFDAWVICGHLRNCSDNTPIANATVKAFDADLITDDFLGSAVTDASGHFRIDYSSADFRVNFIPWGLETDNTFPFFTSGPDVYFTAELGGVLLIKETDSDRRNNVGYCLCVDLCSKKHVGPIDDPFPSAWTGIGLAFNASFGAGSKDFDAQGYAGSGKYGLFGNIRLTGQAPAKSAAGNNIEYRFLISSVTTPNGAAAPALANFNKIIGKDAGLFVSSTVAKLQEKVSPFTVYDVDSDASDFDADGWFDINNALARTQTIHGLGALSNYWFIDEDTLISLNTAAFTSESNVPDNAADAGSPVPVANKIAIEKIAIRFEIREVVNKPLNIFNIIAGSGKTLNSVIINNNASFAKLAITEMGALACAPISGLLHAEYTVHHPHLKTVSLNLHNNSWSINKNYNDLGPVNHIIGLSNNLNTTLDGGFNNSLPLNPADDLVRCTYSLTLYIYRRLHNGDTQIGHEERQILFFYDA